MALSPTLFSAVNDSSARQGPTIHLWPLQPSENGLMKSKYVQNEA
jgi:hypothetical protein